MSFIFHLIQYLLIFFLSLTRFIKNTIVFYRGENTWTRFFLYILDLTLNGAFWFMIFFLSMVNQPCPYATLPFIYYSFKYYLKNIKNNKYLVSTKKQRLTKIYGITLFLTASPVYLTTILFNCKHYVYITNYKIFSLKTDLYNNLFSKFKNKKYNMFNNYVKTKLVIFFNSRALITTSVWYPLSRRSPYFRLSRRF